MAFLRPPETQHTLLVMPLGSWQWNSSEQCPWLWSSGSSVGDTVKSLRWGGLDPAVGDFSSFPEIALAWWSDWLLPWWSGNSRPLHAVWKTRICRQRWGSWYDSSRSKRITYHRLIWKYNNTLLSEELCFHCLLVFSVKKQRDLSFFSCIRRRDESKVQSSEGQMKLNLLSMLPRNSKFDCHTLLKRFKIQIQQREWQG